MGAGPPWIVQRFKAIARRQYSTRDILLLAFAALAFNFAATRVYASLGYGFPYNTFLFDPADRFGDFFKIIDALHVVDTWEPGNPYDREGLYYYKYLFPCTATFYFLFATIIEVVGDKYLVYLALVGTVFLVTTIVARKSGHEWSIIPFLLITYPFIHAIDRGNIALVVFLLILVSIYIDNLWISTLALALAASIKFTPIIFIVPLILRQELTYRRVLMAIGLTCCWLLVVNFVCIQVNGKFLSPSEFNPVVLIGSMLTEYSDYAVGQMAGLAFNSSLYMALLYLASKWTQLQLMVTGISPLVLPVFTFTIIGFALLLRSMRSRMTNQIKKRMTTAAIYLDICLVFAAIKTAVIAVPLSIIALVAQYYSVSPRLLAETADKFLTFEKMVFVASISFMVFMPVSGDYYLTTMLLPLIFFPRMKFSFWYFLAYGLLLGVKNFPYIDRAAFGQPISLQVVINPLLMMLMLFAEFDLLSFMGRLSLPTEHSQAADLKEFSVG